MCINFFLPDLVRILPFPIKTNPRYVFTLGKTRRKAGIGIRHTGFSHPLASLWVLPCSKLASPPADGLSPHGRKNPSILASLPEPRGTRWFSRQILAEKVIGKDSDQPNLGHVQS